MEYAVYIAESEIDNFRSRIEELSQLISFNYDFRDLVNPRKKIFVDERREVYSYEPFNDARPFIEIVPHSIVGGVIDPVSGVSAVTFVVEYSDRGEAVLVPRGVKTFIIEARGRRVYQLVEEGSEVFPGDKVFYIVTGKHEVRVVRSAVEGVLVHISELVPSKVQTLRAVVVPREQCRRLRRVR